MAATWIKIRVDLLRDPAVLKMSDTCRTNRHHIVGLLSDVWGWLDGHTADGTCPNVSLDMIDAYTGTPGFAAAMVDAGWLEPAEKGVVFPKWERHNSASAKARAMENEAKRLRRQAGKNSVRQVSDKTSDKVSSKSPLREEKRREEKNKVKAPQLSDEEWLAALAANPAFSHINIPAELQRAQTWIQNKNGKRVFTRRFFEGWLKRTEKPLALQITDTRKPSEKY
jgi:hypothetical protein